MAKRPLSVQLRPSSALREGGAAGSCLSARRLSMGDVVTGEQRASSSDLTGGGGVDAGSSGGRRPADLGIIAGSSCLPRRRDRCSPSTCKRPIVLTLPRLDLSLIQESSLWKDEESVSQGQGQTARSRDCRVPCRCSTPSVPLISSSSSSSSSMSSSFSCECLAACHPTLTAASLSATSASESTSLFGVEPTSILPFLFLGSQRDALSSDVINKHGIEYVVNVSATCPQSPFVAESKFLRIPVNDGQQDRLLPFFSDVFQFLDAVRESSGRVLVHCLAGISRSPTVVIAYVMHHLRLPIDDAYRYVKTRRPTISPNFNFLGQLVEFDTQLTKQRSGDSASLAASTTESSCFSRMNLEVPERAPSPSKRPCMINLSHAAESRRSLGVDGVTVQSPTVALSRLQFVEQRQTSSTAAVNVPPKPTSTDGFLTQSPPACQSKPRTTDNSTGVVQDEQQVTASPSSSSSFTGTDVSTSHGKACRSVSLSQGTQHQEQQKLPSSSSWSHQSTSTTSGGEMVAVSVDKERTAATNVTADMLLVDWQTSFKSRSLEDILLVSGTPPRSLGHGQGHVTSHWTPAGDGQCDESSRLSGHGSLTASHGSLSTGHASLHGSLEMIQVS